MKPPQHGRHNPIFHASFQLRVNFDDASFFVGMGAADGLDSRDAGAISGSSNSNSPGSWTEVQISTWGVQGLECQSSLWISPWHGLGVVPESWT